MTRLVLINGAPGSGKSSLAHALAQDARMTLALDIDTIKHSLGGWDEDPSAAGLHARRLCLALASEQMRAGFDLVLGQYLAKTMFIEALEELSSRHGARFHEVVLELDAAVLKDRLARRRGLPDRSEHAINNQFVGPEDARALVEAIEALRRSRPHAIWVDARGPHSSTLDIVRSILDAPN